jgi:hypothetical protein
MNGHDPVQSIFFKSLGISSNDNAFAAVRTVWSDPGFEPNAAKGKFTRAPGFVHINGAIFGTVHLDTGRQEGD